MPIEHRGAVPQYPGDSKWDSSAWYDDENVLPEWAKEQIRTERRRIQEADEQDAEESTVQAEQGDNNG